MTTPTSSQAMLLACLVCTVACTAVAIPEPPPNTQITMIASAYCDRLFTCQPHYAGIAFGNLAACTKRESLRVHLDVLAPGASLKGIDLAACATAVATTSCDLIGLHGPPRCYYGPGPQAKQEPCARNSQCQSRRCSSLNHQGCGHCYDEAQVGDSCVWVDCAPGLACVKNDEDGTRRCQPVATLGQSCSPIAYPYYVNMCAHGLQCRNGACEPWRTEAKCSSIHDCDHAQGYGCQWGKCGLIPLRGPGAACSVSGKGDVGYAECTAALCLSQNDMGNGKCVPFAADGDPCGGWDGPDCQPPAQCVSGVCSVGTGYECL